MDSVFDDPFFHIDWNQFEDHLLRSSAAEQRPQSPPPQSHQQAAAVPDVYYYQQRVTNNVVVRNGTTTTRHHEDHSVRRDSAQAPVVSESRRVRSSYDHARQEHLQTLAQRLRREGEWADVREYAKIGDAPAVRRRRGQLPRTVPDRHRPTIANKE